MLREALCGQSALTEPVSPALLSWRLDRDLKFYNAFARGLDDWRAPALQLLQAALLYFSARPDPGGLRGLLGTDGSLMWLIAVLTTRGAAFQFRLEELFARTPASTTLGEWAALIRSITTQSPHAKPSTEINCFTVVAEAIEELTEQEQSRPINTGQVDSFPASKHSVSEASLHPPTRLSASAEALLTASGISAPGRLDLSHFAANALDAIELAPAREKLSAHWATLRTALHDLGKAPPDLPLLVDDYTHWWRAEAPVLYRSVLAGERDSEGRLHQPIVASLCLRAALIHPPVEDSAKQVWLESIGVLNRMAHDLYLRSTDTGESRLGRVVACIPNGLTTKASASKLRALAEEDPGVASDVASLLVVLEAINKASQVKAHAPEAPGSTYVDPIVDDDGQSNSAAQRFLHRISAVGILHSDREGLTKALTGMVPVAQAHASGSNTVRALAEVLAALNPPTTEAPSRSAADQGPSLKSPPFSALTLQPGADLEHGLRTLQLILFQHVFAPPRYMAGKRIWTQDLDAPLANLILTIDGMAAPDLRAEAARYLERVPPIPADAEDFDRLWKRQEKRALASSDVRTIVDVLRCIQRDRGVAPAPKPGTGGSPLRQLSPSSNSAVQQTGTDSRHRPSCSSAPRRFRSKSAAQVGTSRIERRCKTTALRGLIRRPTKEELDRARQNGETIEEIVGEFEAAVTEARPRAVGRAQQRAFADRQVSAMRQGVWARHQWDALTTEESAAFVDWLLAQARIDWSTPDYVRREAIAICLVMAITGFTLSRAYAIRMKWPPESGEDSWEPERGALSFPVPGTDARFKPTEAQASYLEEVASRVSITLPQEAASILHALEAFGDPFIFACDLKSLAASVAEVILQAREHLPRLSLARIQRSAQLEVLNQVGDIATAQLICGDSLGVAPTPMAYYAAREDLIQEGYSRAVKRFGLTPQPPDRYMSGRVGSRLLVTRAAMSTFVANVQCGLVQVPKAARSQGRAAAVLHATLVPSLAILFKAATGHRPTFRIGHMTSRSICLHGSLAVIEDKISDEQHESRLVPLCPLLRASIAAYGKHLERLARNDALIEAHRQAASDALCGAGPLFFLFDGAGSRPLTVDDLNHRLPPNWPLPKNFLRHHAATRLRDQGCPGVYVQALLGHLEAGIQPFGAESFMSPPAYLAEVATQIESMLRTDGWRCLLGGDDDYDVFLRYAPSLSKETIGLQSRLALASQDQYRKQRRHVEHVKTERKGEIDAWTKGLIDAALLAATKPKEDGPPEINADAVSDMRMTICASADDVAHAEAAIDTLRLQLRDGRTQGLWNVKRLPSFYVPRPSPAVFNPSFVGLYSSILRLRQKLRSEIVQSPEVDPQDAVCRCILAIVLWHGVCEHERLRQLLRGIPLARRAGSIDALVVPVDLVESATGRVKTSSEVLRGVVALLAQAAQDPLKSDLAEGAVEAILRSWIPREVIGCSDRDLLGVLFEAAATAHRFESIGPVREVWTGNYTSVSLPPGRLLALVDSASPRSTDTLSLPIEPSTSAVRAVSAEASVQANKLKLGYRWLKDLLRYRPGKPKTFPIYAPDVGTTKRARQRTLEVSPSQLERNIRKEIIRRLEERLNQWPEDGSLLRALTAYALDRLKYGTPWKSRVGLRTVYGYVLGAGTPMLAQHDGTPLDQLDAEDYHEIYEACIQGSQYVAPAKLSRLLAYFHGYLAAKCGAPSVAIGVSTKIGRCFPDVGYITPREYLRAQQLIDNCVASAQASKGSTAELKAAAVALPLGFSTGARTSEVLLREADELSYDEGRRALLVRGNRFTPVKTLRATRQVSIEGVVGTADWSRIESWRDDANALRRKGCSGNSALLPEWTSGRPIDPDRLAKLLGEALRCATGLEEARPYWWRHTVSSNELLTHLAGTDVLHVLTQDGVLPSLGLGASGEAVGYPPKEIPLSQAHAANYRARRGHWRMRTSIETYVHLIALIEPHASRQISQGLSVDQLARLAGLSPQAARKRLVRAGVSASHRSRVVHVLLGGSAEPTASESEAPSNSKAVPFTREIDVATTVSAIVSAVRAGDLALAARALHMTSTEASRWESALCTAVERNLFGAELPSTTKLASEDARFGVVRRMKKHRLQVQRVNTSWLIDCVERALGDPHALEAWTVVLRGLDLASGCIAASSQAEIAALLTEFPLEGKDIEGHPSLTVELVTRAADAVDARMVKIRTGTTTLSVPVNASARFQPPLGFINIGAVVKDSNRGRAMSSTLLFAAVLVCAACEILGTGRQSTH